MASAELLKQIQSGKRLRKADTNDRSVPLIDSKASGGGAGIGAAAAARVGGASSSTAAGGPPQLGGLFAGGIPKLKPAGQSNLGIVT